MVAGQSKHQSAELAPGRLRPIMGSIAFYLVALTVSYTAFYAFSRNLELFQSNYLPFEFNRHGVLTGATAFETGLNAIHLVPGDRIIAVNDLRVDDGRAIRTAVAASAAGVTHFRFVSSNTKRERVIHWMNVPAMPRMDLSQIEGISANSNPLFLEAGIPQDSPLVKASIPLGWGDRNDTRAQAMLHMVFETPGKDVPAEEVVLALLDRRIPWGLYGVAVSFCLLGVLVYRLQPGSDKARGFFYFCSYLGLFYFTRSIHPYYRDVWDRLLLDHLMSLSPIPSVLFVATFTPMRHVLDGERKPAALALTATSILLVLMAIGQMQVFMLAWLGFLLVLMSSSIIASVWIIMRQTAATGREREGGLIYVIALGAAFIPYSLYMGFRILTHSGAEMQMIFEILPFLFPITIGYAVVRHNLLNVHELVLQGFLFTSLGLFLVVGYGVVVGVVAPLVERVVLVDSLWIVGAGVALLVLGAMPVYQTLRSGLEGRFERGLARYDELIHDIERVRADEKEVAEFYASVLHRIARIAETADAAFIHSSSLSLSDGPAKILATTSPAFSLELQNAIESRPLPWNEERPDRAGEIPGVPVLMRIRGEDDQSIHLALGEKVLRRSYGWHELSKLRQTTRAIALALHGFDIRERVREKARLEAELLQSQKLEALGALAGGITHDFNNLLYAISSFTTLANDAITPEHPAHAALDHVEEAARQARSMTGSILKFVRSSAAAPTPVDVNRLVREAADMLRRLLPASIELDVRLPDESVIMHAEESQIYQVVMNLVLNARDAMPNGGELILTLTRHSMPNGESVRLEVEDSGCGMTTELRTRIFDPGFTTKSPDRGVGLGLAIVRRIVANYQGRIEVDSEPEGGTRFVVEFPDLAPRSEGPARALPSGELLVGIMMRDQDSARFLTTRIKSRGWKTRMLKSPSDLADLAGEMSGLPDALIAEAALVGGPEAARDLLKRHPDLPVLFVGEDLDEVLGDEIARRAHCLPKPCSVEQLIEGISLILEPAPAPAAP